MRAAPKPLKDGRENLRGRKVLVEIDGQWLRVEVLTHIRDDKWMVQGHQLPSRFMRRFVGRRTVVSEADIRFIE